MKKWLNKLKIPASIYILGYVILAIPELYYQNVGESRSLGSVRQGGLENAYLLPFFGQNFRFFSGWSYFIANNGYVDSRTYRTVLAAYKTCATTCPGVNFQIMECSDRHGGKMLIHSTHQNGMSVDFMVPKKWNEQATRICDHFGYFHYLLDFDRDGRLYGLPAVSIDFEVMARHILAIDTAAREQGLRIRKVIFRLELKDEFFATVSGQEVQQRGIYFVQSMPYWTNRVHDDHYHIDFESIEY